MKLKTKIFILTLIIAHIYIPSNAINTFKLLDDYRFAKDNFNWVKKDFYFYLDYKCKEKNIDPLFALAIAQVESGGKNIISKRNKNGSHDYGIFQVNEIHTKKHFELLNYKHNIDKAMSYLNLCLKKAEGNKYLACIYYNGGINCNVNKYTSPYPLRVLKKYNEITIDYF